MSFEVGDLPLGRELLKAVRAAAPNAAFVSPYLAFSIILHTPFTVAGGVNPVDRSPGMGPVIPLPARRQAMSML
jgi:hypothetical protein